MFLSNVPFSLSAHPGSSQTILLCVTWFEERPFLFAENAITTIVIFVVTEAVVVIAMVTVVMTVRIPVAVRRSTFGGVSWHKMAWFRAVPTWFSGQE